MPANFSFSFETAFEFYNGTAANSSFEYDGSKILIADGKEGNDNILGGSQAGMGLNPVVAPTATQCWR